MGKLSLIYERIKKILGPDWITPLCLVVFVIAWTLNAFKKTDFDIPQLQGMYTTLRGALLLQHGIDSTVNSKMGEMPKRIERNEVGGA